MHYQVVFVEDCELPCGVEFAFAVVADETYLFMKRSVVDPSAGECVALTRSFNTWQRAQSVELKELARAL